MASACGASKLNGTAAVPPAPAVTSPSTTAPGVYPLTGLAVDSTDRAGRPALSVKVDNVAGSFPQEGLNNADIVTEALVEGGLTRLLATFQSHDASLVGPIRSARPVDAPLLRELGGGIFAYSGAAREEIAPVRASSTAVLLAYDDGVPVFHKVSWRSSPHNVFAYSSSPAGGTPAGSAYMDFSNFSSAAWTWSPGSGVYLRTQNGSADNTADGGQINATNVVVMSVAIGHTGIFDAAHNEDPLPEVIGSGTLWVLRDGKVIQGTWQRSGITSSVQLLDAAGKPIALHPGRTWIELLPQPHSPRLS